MGDIGGIDKKVISASKAHAKIFFAPDNPVSKVVKKYDPNAKSNYEEAVETAKEIHTKMKIVPVRSFNDAVNYLEIISINGVIKIEEIFITSFFANYYIIYVC